MTEFTTAFLDVHSLVNKAMRARTEPALQALGLHLGQDRLLAELWREDGRSPGEIAAAVNVTTPAVVKMATRMEASGLITRRKDLRDARLVRLWLTDKGRDLREPVERVWRDVESEAVGGLSGEEYAQLVALTAKVDRALKG